MGNLISLEPIYYFVTNVTVLNVQTNLDIRFGSKKLIRLVFAFQCDKSNIFLYFQK